MSEMQYCFGKRTIFASSKSKGNILFPLSTKVNLTFLGADSFSSKQMHNPDWCGSIGWMSYCKVKGHQVNSWSGHMA